ncbi:MAG: hypothetical protein KBC38_00395 [Candidatus Pacebacteria bacterium]|nr:hypothetical protein [Candidatus Paceibacterota bacterium]MBP9840456.1 hypothetical protein [Candidatus Paceibacterota bacterium]
MIVAGKVKGAEGFPRRLVCAAVVAYSSTMAPCLSIHMVKSEHQAAISPSCVCCLSPNQNRFS